MYVYVVCWNFFFYNFHRANSVSFITGYCCYPDMSWHFMQQFWIVHCLGACTSSVAAEIFEAMACKNRGKGRGDDSRDGIYYLRILILILMKIILL